MRLRVRELRKERGLTLQQLAEAVGLSKPFLSQLETGSREPGPQTLQALADYFRVGVPDLFDGEAEAADLGELATLHERMTPQQRATLLRMALALLDDPSN